MKKYLQVCFLLLVLLSSARSYASVVKVKGYVLFTGGSPVAGAQIKIAGYLAGSTTPCSEQVVTANAMGFYVLELNCTGDINRTRIVVKNCDGQYLVQEKEVPSSKVVEANFTVCKPGEPITCTAKFNAEPVSSTSTLPPFSFQFNSSSSEVTAGDKIIHRTWDFHDGSPLVTDRVDPPHTFPHAGTYEVCLIIKTDKGCESKICKVIVVPPVTPVTCTAKLNAEPVPATSTVPSFSFQFNSSSSEVTAGDKIIHRTWDFHDGSPLVNDRVDPPHTFPHAGTYEVCLVIKTDKGCESKICKVIVVPPVTPVTCTAKFNAEPAPVTSTLPPFSFQFNSSSSEVTAGDKITHRTWDFHDGSPLVNDRVDPPHTFPHAGTYEVCLVIKTDKGCESKICKVIVVPPVTPVTCTAKFNAEPVPPTSSLPPFSFQFNSSSSEVSAGDRIIHRTWDFHDGSPLVNDRVDPPHTFPHAGTYEVCLIIKTDKGCESKICKVIVVPPVTPVTCTAKFNFERVSVNKFRFNGNLSIVAPNDYVTGRKWDFHDGTTSTEVSPLHEFVKPGNYEVCLTIKTAKGCESHYCTLIKVEEVPMSANDYVKIISLFPSPVRENLKAVVYCKQNNITGSISIVNLYGSVQYTRPVVLLQGYNTFTLPAYSLMHGSYFFKVKTQYGTVSKPFYKM